MPTYHEYSDTPEPQREDTSPLRTLIVYVVGIVIVCGVVAGLYWVYFVR